MKRLAVILTLGMIVLFSAVSIADEEKQKPEVVTLTGEIVDTGCYLGHAAKGEGHKSCALRCVAGGMPMAILTGEDALYLLTMNHDDADPYNSAKEMAARMVEITGPIHERNGMKSIEVIGIKEVKSSGSKK